MIEFLLQPFAYEFMVRALVVTVLAAVVCAVLSCWLVLVGWSLMVVLSPFPNFTYSCMLIAVEWPANFARNPTDAANADGIENPEPPAAGARWRSG